MLQKTTYCISDITFAKKRRCRDSLQFTMKEGVDLFFCNVFPIQLITREFARVETDIFPTYHPWLGFCWTFLLCSEFNPQVFCCVTKNDVGENENSCHLIDIPR